MLLRVVIFCWKSKFEIFFHCGIIFFSVLRISWHSKCVELSTLSTAPPGNFGAGEWFPTVHHHNIWSACLSRVFALVGIVLLLKFQCKVLKKVSGIRVLGFPNVRGEAVKKKTKSKSLQRKKKKFWQKLIKVCDISGSTRMYVPQRLFLPLLWAGRN